MVQCSVCYNICFFTYAWLTPVFLRYLFTAHSYKPHSPFHTVPLKTLAGEVPELYMSSFPQTTALGVNHCRPCQEVGGQRSGMYQWDITLSMSYEDLIKQSRDKPVSTMYPLVFASRDAKVWNVVADADDVAGKWHSSESAGPGSATHLSAPLLVANLKNFGCIDDETADTDPYFHHFSSVETAKSYKWNLMNHMAMHGAVNLVACVMQGMDDMNQLIHTYARDCRFKGEVKCHLSSKEALKKCFALGSACGSACGIFGSQPPECIDDTLDPALFVGLTERRVKVKVSPSGAGPGEALKYCTQKPCKQGRHFTNMYVEAKNPIEFLKSQMDARNREKGSFYVLMFAMSDFHPPMHTFNIEVSNDDDEGGEEGSDDDDDDSDNKDKDSVKKDDKDEDKDEDKDTVKKDEHKKHDTEKKDEHKDTVKKDGHKDKDKEEGKKAEHKVDHKKSTTHKPTKAPHPHKDKKKKKKKKVHSRTCVDLPGVRLNEIKGSHLKTLIAKPQTSDPLGCTAACGKDLKCSQSIFAAKNQGCYTFNAPAVSAKDYDPGFNSSYCGDSDKKEEMMMMLHQAYKAFVPPSKPAAAMPAGPPPLTRVLSELPPGAGVSGGGSSADEPVTSDRKYYWQIAHVPNLTIGVLTDQGANEVQVVPRNTSCFSTPGFLFMVACMTSKPVYISDRTHQLDPPPFNDRCLAVGGKCGATCGSAQEADETVGTQCAANTGPRRLAAVSASPYSSATIRSNYLVGTITAKKPSDAPAIAARFFFNMFVVISIMTYIATLISKFPGNFSDNHILHTWAEIRTHGYLCDHFGSVVTCSSSTDENKMMILRNWIGKATARVQFDDRDVSTFKKWVDVFVDDGHREGARLLWAAWTDFLDSDPPVSFLKDWATNLKQVTWEQTLERSPFDLKWGDGKGKSVLPLVREQAKQVTGTEDALDGGVVLQRDTLWKLRNLYEIYKSLPSDLKLEQSMPSGDDVILTRRVMLGMLDGAHKNDSCHTFEYRQGWQKEYDGWLEGRMKSQKVLAANKDQFQKSVVGIDNNGKKVDMANAARFDQSMFPIHIRDGNRKTVIMMYCARAKPDMDTHNKTAPKRELDEFMWACLRPKAVRKSFDAKRTFKRKPPEETPLLNTGDDFSERSWSSVSGPSQVESLLDEIKPCVDGVVERQNMRFLDRIDDTGDNVLRHELTQNYLKYRTVDSDWELARFCSGQVKTTERDIDGDEVVILDNPSSALLELISDLHASGKATSKASGRPLLGLAAVETAGENSFLGASRTVHATAPTLEFLFNIPKNSNHGSGQFQAEFKKQMKQLLGDAVKDVNALVTKEKKRDIGLCLEVSGPGRIIEHIRQNNIREMKVMDYFGRMIDSHPHVIVKKDLLMPYAGVKGRSGGYNFIIDLLQFRDGFIGTGESDPTPDCMLFGVVETRFQPLPDFWRKCLPKVMKNANSGYEYKVNQDVCLVQAPESFCGEGPKDPDVQDENEQLTGVSYSVLNHIRQRCGGVTSCGTNAVWLVNAKDFNREDDRTVTNEYFHSRTLLEGVATTHMNFGRGKRSVYVEETCCTGIAKRPSDCLCDLQRKIEGAVQLFWVEIFSDRSVSMVILAAMFCVILVLTMHSCQNAWIQDGLGFNVFCSTTTRPTMSGSEFPLCHAVHYVMSNFVMDHNTWESNEKDFMTLVDTSIIWFVICVVLTLVAGILSCRGIMPSIVRAVIRLEDITYWMTSLNVIYWLVLIFFMVIGMDPPLMYDPPLFMTIFLLLNVTQHSMLNHYKAMIETVTEISIWRSQVSHTLAAPLSLSAIWSGTRSAMGVIWKKLDESFWKKNAEDNAENLNKLTVWVTNIWIAFAGCIAYTVFIYAKRSWDGFLTGATSNPVENLRLHSSLVLLAMISISVWDAFISLWEADRWLESVANNEKKNVLQRNATKLLLWGRTRAWIFRYVIDFAVPVYVICGGPGGVILVTLAAYASTVHSLRM